VDANFSHRGEVDSTARRVHQHLSAAEVIGVARDIAARSECEANWIPGTDRIVSV
jgi:hypothetical protein